MTSGAEAWPPGTPVGLPLPACPWVSLHPQTHLPSVASVCTESGVHCTYDSEGEWWAALLVPGVSGPRLRPGPLTACPPHSLCLHLRREALPSRGSHLPHDGRHGGLHLRPLRG